MYFLKIYRKRQLNYGNSWEQHEQMLPLVSSYPNENTFPAGAAVDVAGDPKVNPEACADVAGVARENRPVDWVLAGVWVGVPKLNPAPLPVVNEYAVGAVVAAVFGVPKLNPPPAEPDPKLNWLIMISDSEKKKKK